MSVKKRGTSWRARFRDDSGREHQKSFARKADAEAWEREQRRALDRGDWLDPTAGHVPFRAYATEWLTAQQHMRPSTRAQAESRLRLHVFPVVGDLPLARIRRSDVQQVITRASRTLAPSTVRIVHAYTTSVLSAAVADRLIASSPAVGISLPQPERARMTPPTPEQVAHLAEKVPPRFRALVVLVAATGLRSGEARALTADRLSPRLHLRGRVVPQQVTISVDRSLRDDRSFGPTKTTAAVRDVTVGPTVARTLAEHIATFGLGPDGLLFHDNGKALLRGQAGRVWKQAADGMGLRSRSGWHDLRHAHASTLLSEGVSIAAVSARLGHSSPTETLAAYAWAMPSDEQRIVDVTERAMRL